MRRYFAVLSLFWRTSLASELEYRLNFLLAFLSSLGHLVGNLFGLSLFYTGSGSLGGWPFHQALLVMGFFSTLQGLNKVLLSPNLARIVEHVRTGTLDFVLLKPLDSQFWLSTRRISPWGVPDVLFGLGTAVYAAVQLGLPAHRLALAAGPFFLSAVIQYSLWFLLASLSIWYVKIYRFVFSFVIPVALLTTVPAKVALAQPIGSWLIVSLAFALGAFLLSRAFWRHALRYYTSASS